MKPTIFEQRLEYKPRLKFFKFWPLVDLQIAESKFEIRGDNSQGMLKEGSTFGSAVTFLAKKKVSSDRLGPL